MEQWIPYEEGDYAVEGAFLCVPEGHGLQVDDVVVTVFTDNRGLRQLSGYGRLENTLLMDLLDHGSRVDLVLDLAPGHRYRLVEPLIRAGKLFTPGVRSSFHFHPREPWAPLSDPRFDDLLRATSFLSG